METDRLLNDKVLKEAFELKKKLKWRWQKSQRKKRGNIRRHLRRKWLESVRMCACFAPQHVCLRWYFWVSNPKLVTTGCFSDSSLLTGSFITASVYSSLLCVRRWGGGGGGGAGGGGGGGWKGRHPVSRPRCLARMCAAMRRRQPRDRIDYDSRLCR